MPRSNDGIAEVYNRYYFMSRIGEKLHLDHQICNVEKQLQELLRCHRRAAIPYHHTLLEIIVDGRLSVHST